MTERSHFRFIFLKQVQDHFFEALLPKSGMAESDRLLLKEKLSSHVVYRENSGDGDCTWMARLKKSGIECFHLLEDFFLVYIKILVLHQIIVVKLLLTVK